MKKYIQLLKEELNNLESARDILCYSYDKCSKIGVKLGMNYEEAESFEALTSRFARLSDILIQKILRIFDLLELENNGSVLDRLNRAEKRGIIDNVDDFIEIRILRNEIAHEYKSETIYDIFEKVIVFTPVLLKSVDNIVQYSDKHIK